MALHGPFLKLRWDKREFLLRVESISGVVGPLGGQSYTEIWTEEGTEGWKTSNSFATIQRALTAALSSDAARPDSSMLFIVDGANYEPTEIKP